MYRQVIELEVFRFFCKIVWKGLQYWQIWIGEVDIVRNILVVDDAKINRSLMKAVLECMKDCIFHEAEDGSTALNILNEEDIDLVILDLVMPDKSGFDVLQEMKLKKKLKDIPVIVYSAMDNIESVSKALEMGAYDYFTKPLKPQQMQVIVPMKAKNALQNYEQHKTIQRLNGKMKLDRLLANLFQQTMMAEKQELPNINMYGKYVPCQEIGGDIYDCAQIGDVVWFIIADVAEYGVSAAMLSSMVKIEFNHCIGSMTSPEAVLRHMNNTFYKIAQGNHRLTAFIGMIEGDILKYANGGQPYPLLFNSVEERVQLLRQTGPELGLAAEQDFGLESIRVISGDIIMLYTEGLLENKIINDGSDVYDELKNFFLTHRALIQERPSEFIETIISLYGSIYNNSLSNDVAIMLICIK